MEDDQVKVNHNNKPTCPFHGQQDTAYKEHEAPCGCQWYWREDGKLIAIPPYFVTNVDDRPEPKA